ncbi:FkbM family methyltransferase [Mycolicibacterium moriokaense]|nr:FkbM family methyltransferase [Mycolicibacterium moriokaense]
MIKRRMQHDHMPAIIRRYVRRADTVVDIGANRGVYTWLMSRRVGANGCVHCIEPYPGNIQSLGALAKSRPNITVHPVGLSDAAGEAILQVPLYQDQRLAALATFRPTVDVDCYQVSVPTARLDELIDTTERRVSFIKCDVEGHEDAVIAGAWGIINRDRPVLVMEIEQRYRTTPVTDLIERLVSVGYSAYFLDSHGSHSVDQFDVNRHQLGYLDSKFVPYSAPHGYVADFMFIPDGQSAEG